MQTHNEVEHLVIDGGSSDGTLELLNEIVRSPSRITDENHGTSYVLISESDRGIYHALNKGLGLATGDVVGFMHSDDFFANAQVLERVALVFADPTVDGVYGDLDYVSRADPTRIIRRWRSGSQVREAGSRDVPHVRERIAA